VQGEGPGVKGTETDKGLLVALPSGERVYYVDDTHAYYLCKEDGDRGKRLTGVTTITKVFDTDSSRLLNWAARTQCIGIAEAWAAGGSSDWLASADEIWAHLESLGLTFEDVRNKASRIGTNVHVHAFEAMGRGDEVPDFEKLTKDEQGHSNAILKFWLDHEPAAEQVEQIVFSPKLGVAGRLDFRGKLSPCDDLSCPCHKLPKGPGVVDCKTGKYIFAADHLQVAGYRRLSKESGYGDSKWATLLHTRADGTYELVVSQASPQHFNAAVKCYRHVGEVDRKARKAWKEANG
jgi:hypothetical protein